MDVKLLIGNQEADINSNIPVEFCQCDLRNIDSGSVQSSYDIDIPLTKKNQELIKYSNELNVFEEITEEGKILYKNTEIFRGSIKQLKSQKYLCSLIIQGNNWMDQFDEISLNDLDLSAYNEVYNTTNIQASWTASDPFIRYPLINWGRPCFWTDAVPSRYANDFAPWFNLYKILMKIFSMYTVESVFLNSDYFKSIYIFAKEFCQESSFTSEKALEVSPVDGNENRVSNVYAPGNDKPTVATFNPVSFLNEISDDGTDFAAGVYTIPETGTYRIQFIADPRMQYAGLTVTGSTHYVLEIRLNSVMIETVSGTVDPGTNTFTLETEYRHFTAGDQISCYCHMDVWLKNNITESITCYLYMAHTTKLINILDGYCLNAGITMTIEPEKWLPDVKQSDFISAVKQLFNLQFFLDKWNNKLYIEPLQTWRTTNQVNVQIINEDAVKIERISSNYSQKILFEFADDIDDQSLTDYEKTSKTKVGRKELTLLSGYADSGEMTIKNGLFSTFYRKSGAIPIIWGNYDKDNFERPQSRATVLGMKIATWHGFTTASTWLYEGAVVNYRPYMDQIDFSTLFDNYYAKTFHLIDNSKILTTEIKTYSNYLQQFITVVNDITKEGFRPEYVFTILGETYIGHLNRISFDGERAICEFILKV